MDSSASSALSRPWHTILRVFTKKNVIKNSAKQLIMDHRFKPFTEDWQMSPGQVGANYASNDLRIAFTDDGPILRRRLARVRSGKASPRQVYGLSPKWMYLIPRHVSPWSTKAVSVSTYIRPSGEPCGQPFPSLASTIGPAFITHARHSGLCIPLRHTCSADKRPVTTSHG